MNTEGASDNLLASGIDTRKRVSYQRKLTEYCATYGVETDRAIKFWVRIGKKFGRLPPLDDPPRMAAWWAACMVTRVPDKLLKLSEDVPAPLPPPVAVTSPAVLPTPTGEPRDFSNVASMDLREHVEKLRHNLAINQLLLEEARSAGDPNRVTLCERNYAGSFELLRMAEQTLVKVQKDRGDVIDREAISLEVAQACETLALMRQNMGHRLQVELEKLLPRRLARTLKALAPYVAAAVENVRGAEEQILRDLASIDGPAAVSKALAA